MPVRAIPFDRNSVQAESRKSRSVCDIYCTLPITAEMVQMSASLQKYVIRNFSAFGEAGTMANVCGSLFHAVFGDRRLVPGVSGEHAALPSNLLVFQGHP